MPIAGVVIVTAEDKSMNVLEQLSAINHVTTYGIHKDNNIIAVFEGDTPKELELLSEKLINDIPGIMGVFPAYVNYEDEE